MSAIQLVWIIIRNRGKTQFEKLPFYLLLCSSLFVTYSDERFIFVLKTEFKCLVKLKNELWSL